MNIKSRGFMMILLVSELVMCMVLVEDYRCLGLTVQAVPIHIIPVNLKAVTQCEEISVDHLISEIPDYLNNV